MLRRLRRTSGLALGCALVVAAVAFAAAGDLDPKFGTGGKTTTSVGSSNDVADAMIIQDWDGMILVGGSTYNGASKDFALTRYLKNGVIDNGFGTNGSGGKSVLSIGPGDDDVNALVAQGNHKLVAAGSSFANTSNDFELARFNKDGRLDRPFGVDGKVRTSFGDGDDVAYGVAFQPVAGEGDFRLIAVGASFNVTNYDFAIAKYKRVGTPDENFSGNGKIRTAIGPGEDKAFAVTLLPKNGKPIVAGHSWNGSSFDFATVRYNGNGSIDTSFSGDGIITTSFGSGDDSARALLLQPDSRIVVAGYADNGSSDDFAVARYNNNGTPDTSFGGGDGMVTTSIGSGDDQGYAVAIQADGKLVVAGRSWNGANYDFAVIRYTTSGTPDASFGGGDGIVTTPIGPGDDSAYGVGVQVKGGKLVAAGSSHNGSNNDFALAGYLP